MCDECSQAHSSKCNSVTSLCIHQKKKERKAVTQMMMSFVVSQLGVLRAFRDEIVEFKEETFYQIF